MEKSIETIWKEGFIKQNAIIVPKLNDLYNQKSTHIVDKFKRMFKINLIAVVIGSIFILAVSFLVGIPLMGIGFFIALNVIVIINRKLATGLEKINKNESSYQYIKSFDDWMKEQLSINRRMAAVYYPFFFLSTFLGFWYPSKRLSPLKELALSSSDANLVLGIPVYWLLGIVLAMIILAIFGGRIYNFDVSIVYGRVFKKLDEIVADMEELRK